MGNPRLEPSSVKQSGKWLHRHSAPTWVEKVANFGARLFCTKVCYFLDFEPFFSFKKKVVKV